ncbi:MAG: helix-turn-helix transcriptional regulator [Pseudomonadota bacterium]|uniref:Helix-turn-helix domain-containing protein n=1 Tax=Ralstonia pickettii TaxID=329 RepID=A0A7X2HQG6_RALPI|nr:helix-turn-helix transcriptional regulator [Ralstonia pickettii]MEE2979458.1 helix-turn-helix transcriptional regulator [Pseudomonadota bacterium]MRT00786.1 helix-turn-helix domain-containing protein [Ralstonia pickettii]NWK43474.1 helix-turn-helix transcriptional regulator [Ralstonia pickettii]OCS46449.1 hypothetical protein BEK67_16365 [Ralstonia pickettii]WKZ85060.1 helix-turn-helix transcriptional regulator [Ralstonia pickettii]
MKKLDTWLLQELADRKFAHAFLETEANARFAAQVRALRKQHGWTEADLATASRLTGAAISDIENARLNLLQLISLRKLARAFDVHLSLKFESTVDGAVEVVRFVETDLAVPSREAELRMHGVYSVLPPRFGQPE